MEESASREAWARMLETLRDAPRSPGDSPDLVIQQWETEAATRESKARVLLGEAKAFRQMIEAVSMLSGKQPPAMHPEPGPSPSELMGRTVSTPDRPAGTEAIRRIMREGGIWTIKGLLQELRRRGWDSKTAQDPHKATEAAVSRLVTVKKEVERVERGKYRYIGPPNSPGSTAELGMFGNFANGPRT